jgi:hypothetical protein
MVSCCHRADLMSRQPLTQLLGIRRRFSDPGGNAKSGPSDGHSDQMYRLLLCCVWTEGAGC